MVIRITFSYSIIFTTMWAEQFGGNGMVVCKTCQGNLYDGFCKKCNPIVEGYCPACHKQMDHCTLSSVHRTDDGSRIPSGTKYFTCNEFDCHGYNGNRNMVFMKGNVYVYNGNVWVKWLGLV
jgi:hypothetical protein